MNHLLSSESLDMGDEGIRFRRPASGPNLPFQISQPFQPSRGSLGAQPSGAIAYGIDNLAFPFGIDTGQRLRMEDLESVKILSTGEVDVMMQSQAQPMFSPQVMPQSTSFFANGFTQTPSINVGIDDARAFQHFQQPMSFLQEIVTTASPGLQQPRIEPRVTPQTLQPARNSTLENTSFTHNRLPRLGSINPPPRKRAPKALTMSAKKWEPAEDRIRQLFLEGGSTYKELTDTVNKEFGFTATERQYKAKILQMKLKRNVESNDRTTVVRHIRYRKDVCDKVTKYVRVYGHRKPEAMIQQWMKDYPMMAKPTTCRTPSPLPSHISLRTRSQLASPTPPKLTLSQRTLPGKESVAAKSIQDTPVSRLLSYAAHGINNFAKSEKSAAIFNDFQHILGCAHDNCIQPRIVESTWPTREVFDPALEEDIISIRNYMNLHPEVWLGDVSKETANLRPYPPCQSIKNGTKPVHRYGMWRNRYGRVLAEFRSIQTPEHGTVSERCPQSFIAAKIAIQSSVGALGSFRIALHLNPRLSPSAMITYQATLPNDSEIFAIVEFGKVEDLVKALEAKTASLTDRDEEGRSLLNYASTNANVDMCKFLVDKNADINAIEPDTLGFLTPVHCMESYYGLEIEGIVRHKRAQCIRIMLEAGADFSLEMNFGDGVWETGFMDAVEDGSLETLKHVVDLGKPFISINGIYKCTRGEYSALTALAHACGYNSAFTVDVVDKAILLLNRKADISCRDENGDTVLHSLLKCRRLHERLSKNGARRDGLLQDWRLSFETPKDLLKVFITAGADVYATNNDGKTPSMVASEYQREDEWIEALELCGYEFEKVLASGIYRPTGENQTSKLSFQEYCQQRRQRQHPQYDDGDEYEEARSESSDDSHYGNGDAYEEENDAYEEDDDAYEEDEDAYEEDDDEEIGVITDNTECVDNGGRNMDAFGGVKCADYGNNLGLDIEGNEHVYNVEEIVDHRVTGLQGVVEDDIEGMDVDLDAWLDKGLEFMQSFTDFGTFLDTPFE